MRFLLRTVKQRYWMPATEVQISLYNFSSCFATKWQWKINRLGYNIPTGNHQYIHEITLWNNLHYGITMLIHNVRIHINWNLSGACLRKLISQMNVLGFLSFFFSLCFSLSCIPPMFTFLSFGQELSILLISQVPNKLYLC